MKKLTTEDYIIIGKMWEMESNLSFYRVTAALREKRPLEKIEVVHHINGNHYDNRPENLKVCSNKIEHKFYHSKHQGNMIKRYRIKNNFSQDDLAKELKINKALLSQVENGIVLPSSDMLIEISRYLNCLVTDLEIKEEI